MKGGLNANNLVRNDIVSEHQRRPVGALKIATPKQHHFLDTFLDTKSAPIHRLKRKSDMQASEEVAVAARKLQMWNQQCDLFRSIR